MPIHGWIGLVIIIVGLLTSIGLVLRCEFKDVCKLKKRLRKIEKKKRLDLSE